MLYVILYLENSDRASFSDLNKIFETYYVLNKSECPRNVAVIQILLLNYQHNNTSNRQYQYQCFSNQIIFSQWVKTGDYYGETKEGKQKKRKKLEHITCNYCLENSLFRKHLILYAEKLKEGAQVFSNMK